MQKVLVAITYIASEAQGDELALAVAGWRKHFKCPHKIVVVGDTPPDGLADAYLAIERLPEKDGEYRPHLDICNKLEAVCETYKDFAVNDFTLEDVMTPKYQDEEMPSKGDEHPNSWLRNLVKTRRLCEQKKYGVRNWVTHLPLWFDKRHLLLTIWQNHLTEDSYVVENLVFNRFRPHGKPVKLCETDKWKFPVYYSPLDRHGFADALQRKIWVTVSVHGWSEALETELKKHYGL